VVFKKERRVILIRFFKWAAGVLFASSLPLQRIFAGQTAGKKEADMKLPQVTTRGRVSVEEAIGQRRTVRGYASKALALDHLSQLLWACQGITGQSGFKRAAPSAGALYPMDVYAVTGTDVLRPIEGGVYHYNPLGHTLSLVVKGDLRRTVARAALSQMWIAAAPVSVVISAEYDRVSVKYGERGVRYAMIEAGHIGQNLFLQAEALGLKAGIVGAFSDREIIRAMGIPSSHQPLLIMPIGYPA